MQCVRKLVDYPNFSETYQIQALLVLSDFDQLQEVATVLYPWFDSKRLIRSRVFFSVGKPQPFHSAGDRESALNGRARLHQPLYCRPKSTGANM